MQANGNAWEENGNLPIVHFPGSLQCGKAFKFATRRTYIGDGPGEVLSNLIGMCHHDR